MSCAITQLDPDSARHLWVPPVRNPRLFQPSMTPGHEPVPHESAAAGRALAPE